MAVTVNLFRIFAVCSCLVLTYGCKKDCAFCMYHKEQVERTKASSLVTNDNTEFTARINSKGKANDTDRSLKSNIFGLAQILKTGCIRLIHDPRSCTVECEGSVDKQKLEMCRKVLMEVERTTASSLGGADGEAEQQEQMAKKYGGFMKRYGEYIRKKTADLGDNIGAHFDAEATELSKRYGGFMKKDTAASPDSGEARQLQAVTEILRVDARDANHGEEDSKHSAGFMGNPKENPEDLVRDLQKRYGGFMRRVGRPEWLHDYKMYSQLAKRFLMETAETSAPNMEKRYGGFMN